MSKINALEFGKYVKTCKNSLKYELINHNIEASDDDSLSSMIGKLQNFPSNADLYTIQRDIPEFPDLFSIVDNDADISDQTKVRIDVVMDINLSQSMTIPAGAMLKLSDGTVYDNRTGSSNMTVTHTWDLTKDIDTSHNFKMRWGMYINSTSYSIVNYSYGVGIAQYFRNVNHTISVNISYAVMPYKIYDKCILTANDMPTNTTSMIRAFIFRNCTITKNTVSIALPVINADKVYASCLPCFNIDYFEANTCTSMDQKLMSLQICKLKYAGQYSNQNLSLALFTELTNVVASVRVNDLSLSGTMGHVNLEVIIDDISSLQASNAFGGYAGSINLNVKVIDSNISLQSSSDYIPRKTILDTFNKLSDRTGTTALTIKLKSTSISQLTEDEKAIAINKNWTISS